MWIRLRSPKMKGAIFGFQKRVWCPKWTPASSICRMDMLVIEKSPCGVEPPRTPCGNPLDLSAWQAPSHMCRYVCGFGCEKRPRFIP